MSGNGHIQRTQSILLVYWRHFVPFGWEKNEYRVFKKLFKGASPWKSTTQGPTFNPWIRNWNLQASKQASNLMHLESCNFKSVGFYSSSFQKEMKCTSSSSIYIYVYGGNEQWTLKVMDSCNGILVEVYVYMGPCIGTLNLYTKCIYSMYFLPLVLHMLMLRPWEGWVCFSR